ncbi:MAG: KH domain-containing protein, partial [Caldisericales bacterium]|nr:KH domain-containing protein [Caldisericales bacterium]
MSNGNNQKNTKMQEVQVKDFLMEFIPELFKNMGEDAHVRVSKEIDTMFVSVELDDPAVYIGKSGECLASLQFIINMILQRKEWNAVRITLD